MMTSRLMGTAPAAVPPEPLQTLSVLLDLVALIRSVMPIEATVAAAIADLQQRETALTEREEQLLKRENVIRAALADFGADQ